SCRPWFPAFRLINRSIVKGVYMRLLSRLAAVFSLIVMAACDRSAVPQSGTGNSGSPGTGYQSENAAPVRAGGIADTGEIAAGEADGEGGESALAIFERRIMPIFQAREPSSCTECHLSGVDLKDYIHPDQEKTFAALVAARLVDVNQPDRS